MYHDSLSELRSIFCVIFIFNNSLNLKIHPNGQWSPKYFTKGTGHNEGQGTRKKAQNWTPYGRLLATIWYLHYLTEYLTFDAYGVFIILYIFAVLPFAPPRLFPQGLLPAGYNPGPDRRPVPNVRGGGGPPHHRRPVSARGGQLEVAGVVVCSWGPNYSLARGGRGQSPQVGCCCCC